MTRLIRVEILRLFSRRLVRIVGALVLLLVAVIVAIDGYNDSNDTAAEITRFNQQRLAGYDEARAGFERDQQAGHVPKDVAFPTRAEAETDPGWCFPDPDTAKSFDRTPPKQPYAITAKLTDFGRAVAGISAIVAFLIGASAAGAEWAAGTMQSLLYWEPAGSGWSPRRSSGCSSSPQPGSSRPRRCSPSRAARRADPGHHRRNGQRRMDQPPAPRATRHRRRRLRRRPRLRHRLRYPDHRRRGGRRIHLLRRPRGRG